MRVVTTDSTNISDELYLSLSSFVDIIAAANPNVPAVKNMGDSEASGLLYNIKNKTRWTSGQGQIALLFNDQEEIVGVSCVERTRYKYMAIGGIRTWVLKPYRTKDTVSSMLLDSNLDWAKANEMAGMMLTFNDYNRWIYEGVKRKVRGKSPGVASIWGDWWNDCIAIDRPLKVRYVMQWCVVKPTGLYDIPTLRSVIEELDDFG